jgi:hypothetical protein
VKYNRSMSRGPGPTVPARSRRLGSRCAAFLATAAWLVVHPAVGHAQDAKRACIDANEQGQIAQRAGRLRDAREKLVFCAADTCPRILRTDCAKLLADVTASLPSIVVDARDASGAETTRVRVSSDGVVVTESLNGLELPLDPGTHIVRFEAPDGRVVEQSVVLTVGDKRHRVTVDFSKTSPDAGPAAAPPPAASPSSTEPPPAHRSVLPFVLGGVAVVGLASFGGFAIAGFVQEKNLSSSCAPTCKSGSVAPVRTEYLVADISLGVGVVSGAAAAILFLLGHGAPAASSAWRIDVEPRLDGAQVGVARVW